MRDLSFHFLDAELKDKLNTSTELFISISQSPEEFMALLKTLLPIERTSPSTWKTRVEGFYHISEQLFSYALEFGAERYGDQWTRDRLVSEANLRPFSYYHWKTGSREPIANVMTRDDYLNDPSTALVKLEDDILSLGAMLRKIQTENTNDNNKPATEEEPSDNYL